jgi:glycosyltransferase involved in cell wall biosynthesis
MISIVTAYYNRKDLFYRTLQSITKSKFKDIELIAVDDASDPEHRIEDLVEEFPFLKVIRTEPENKWYVNCCIPFNVGLREAKGDIIVLQNPECLHVGDVLTYFNSHINESNYISVSAYGLDSDSKTTDLLIQNLNNGTLSSFIKSLPQRPYMGNRTLGWYNHSKFRPEAWHFCSAMTRGNMGKLNGFDERYATGVACDDSEIIIRIQRLGLKIQITEDVSVIHQYHAPSCTLANEAQLWEQNQILLYKVTMRENITYASNMNKKLWNGN